MNKFTLSGKARILRQRMTDAENHLWFYLRNRRLCGLKFRRQVMIEKYIVDFVCFEKRLIIECDGGQHTVQKAYDDVRTKHLENAGYQILRFWNHEILKDCKVVLEKIYNVCFAPHP